MARFYQTEYIKPNSAYVPLPLDAMAAKLQSMQQAQDQYKAGLDAFDKPFINNPNDFELAQQQKQSVQDKLESLRNMDYNDTANREKIYNTIRNVRDLYGPQGTIGLINAKALAYNTEKERLDKMGEKDPVKAKYLRNELDRQATTGEFSITQDPTTGQYSNTTLTPLQDWQYKDPNNTLGQYAKEVMMEAGVSGVGWETTSADAVKLWRETVTKSKDKDKLDYSLRMRIAGDPDLIMSAHALSSNNKLGTDESQFWTQTGTNKEGKPVYGWNQNTILGRAAEGTAYGAVESDISVQHGTVTDRVGEERAIEDYKNPPPLLVYREGQGLPQGTQMDNSEKVNTNIEDSKNGMKAEFIKLLIAEGQSEENAKIIAGGMDVAGMQQHVNVHRNGKLNGLTDKFDSYNSQLTNLNLLNSEADAYANKIVGAKPDDSQINSINGLSKSETIEVYDLTNRSGKSYAEHADNPEIAADDKRLQYLYQKTFGKPAELGYNGTITQGSIDKLQNAIDAKNKSTDPFDIYLDYNNKRNEAKDTYLKDNANQRVLENKEANKNLVMTEVRNADGSVSTIIDEKATDAVNKQIDTYFEKGEFNSILTTKKKEDGSYYTLEEYRQEKETKLKKDNPDAKVNVSKPWYSNYSKNDEKGNTIKPMSVDVGGEAVEINQNSIQVNYGNGPTSLGQLNSTPAAQTETWLANTASYGIKNKPVNVGGGYTADVQNAKTAGNFANNNNLTVVIKDSNGNPIGQPLVGQSAFNYLTDLQREGLLK